MSMTSVIFIIILAFFTWRGYQKGFVGAITKVLSFIVAYPAAIFLTKPFANIVRAYTGLDGLILFLVAGSTIFLVASVLVTLLLNSLARLAPTNDFTETSSKIGGAGFGIIFGSLVGLIAVYVIDIVAKPNHSTIHQLADKATTTGVITNDQGNNESKNYQQSDEEAEAIKKYVIAEGIPNNDSFIDSTAKKLVSTAASTAVGIITSDKATTQITKTITQDPQAMLNHVQNMTNDGEFKQLLSKPDFQAELNTGNVASLMQNRDFQELMQNPDMQAIIASGDNPLGDNAAEQAAAEKMIQAWQKVSTLKNDPRVLNIVNDPAFQAQLNSPNKLPLLMNPKLRELSEIIFSTNSSTDALDQATTTRKKSTTHYVVQDITNGVTDINQNSTGIEKQSNSHKETEAHEEKLYRWTDENGKVHFSDKPTKH